MKPKVYIETSVVSYLTARPSHDLTTASRQSTTRDLWENLHKFEAYGSELVVGEAEKGHPEAAASRLKEIENAGYTCPEICSPEELLEGEST